MSLITERRNIFKMGRVELRDLTYLKTCPCDLYHPSNYGHDKIWQSGAPLDKEFFLKMIQNKIFYFLTPADQRSQLIEKIQKQLLLTCRRLSTGSTLQNSKILLNFMTTNQKYLYEFPLNNKILDSQYQVARIFNDFLLKNLDLAPQIYSSYRNQKYFYLYSQTITSSIFLSLLLEKIGFNSDKQIENLFVASLFKDIGMSVIPENIYSKDNLSIQEKMIIEKHPQISVDILKGRVPLPKVHFQIISDHHNCLKSSDAPKENDDYIYGVETILLCAMDIFSAMITDRPYRNAHNPFKAFEHLKSSIPNKYNSEFKLIVSFFNQFLGKAH